MGAFLAPNVSQQVFFSFALDFISTFEHRVFGLLKKINWKCRHTYIHFNQNTSTLTLNLSLNEFFHINFFCI